MHPKFVIATVMALAFGQLHAQAPSRRARAGGSGFGLFAYGGTIGGLPVFFSDGTAVITDFKTANNTGSNLVPVAFSSGSDGGAFSAAPNTTAPVFNNATETPPFSNATFFVPGEGSSSHQVGFSSDITSTDIITTGWTFYGHIALLEAAGGSLISLFWAVPSGTEGVWNLTWNETDASSGAIPVTLKDTPPPNLVVKVATALSKKQSLVKKDGAISKMSKSMAGEDDGDEVCE
ncbi:hypothetical protein B0H63DRAFT_515300 [Podospora didyma]|uniref:Uncharacterized protein n=1 Tax=Podospora didyma TaxID=330526 RepID=A0AAE0K2H5_9PEZI|nr:hypothetical protein B0H63DRAFT_515300 [Podospora didyma]